MAKKCLHPGGVALTRQGIEGCNLQMGARVLDVGCGAGTTVELLLKEGFDAYGVDIALEEALMSDRFRRADAAALPYEEGKMDGMMMECSLSKISQPELALAEAHRVLKAGGRLVVADLYAEGVSCQFGGMLGRLSHWEDICRMVERAGFTLLSFEDHKDALLSYWGQLMFDMECTCIEEALGGTQAELNAARCSYFLAVFEAREVTAPPRSPLCRWVYDVAGAAPEDGAGLLQRQMESVRGTVERAREHSPFYRRHLGGIDPAALGTPQDLSALPFTSAETLAAQGTGMLCVPLSQVARIRTISTSGSTGPAKRMWFTEEDMERTVDFFSVGMRDIAAPGQRVAILMSEDKPGSIARLLQLGLARFGAEGVIGGHVREVETAQRLAAEADCLVGMPAELLYLCRKSPHLRPKTVLLSADYVSPSVMKVLEREWGAKVFTHYGLTETCYGLAVQCQGQEKQHLRAADFLVEIIDPDTGVVLPEGQTGEIVLTSLRSQALPLLRYRTGDVSSLQTACACGCQLPGLGPVLGRVVNLRHRVNIHRLDDILLALPGLCAYKATRENDVLSLILEGPPQPEEEIVRQIGGRVNITYEAVWSFRGSKKQKLEEK